MGPTITMTPQQRAMLFGQQTTAAQQPQQPPQQPAGPGNDLFAGVMDGGGNTNLGGLDAYQFLGLPPNLPGNMTPYDAIFGPLDQHAGIDLTSFVTGPPAGSMASIAADAQYWDNQYNGPLSWMKNINTNPKQFDQDAFGVTAADAEEAKKTAAINKAEIDKKYNELDAKYKTGNA